MAAPLLAALAVAAVLALATPAGMEIPRAAALSASPASVGSEDLTMLRISTEAVVTAAHMATASATRAPTRSKDVVVAVAMDGAATMDVAAAVVAVATVAIGEIEEIGEIGEIEEIGEIGQIEALVSAVRGAVTVMATETTIAVDECGR